MSSTERLRGPISGNAASGGTGLSKGSSRLNEIVRELLVVLFALVAFAVVISVAPPGSAAGGGLAGPADWPALLRLSVLALLVAAAAALLYQRPSSRPIIIALALGLILVNLNSALIVKQVETQTGNPWIPQPGSLMPLNEEGRMDVLAGIVSQQVSRLRLYGRYYLVYLLWVVTILYSGYLGRYLVDKGISSIRGRRGPPSGQAVGREDGGARDEAADVEARMSRADAALYVAENAGLGLAASTASGIVAVLLAVIMILFTRSDDAFVRMEVTGAARMVAQYQRRLVGEGRKWQASKLPRGILPARSEVTVKVPRLARLRAYSTFVALCFFIAAYVTALLVRPRTSTWVACGAVLAVMLIPVGAVVWSLNYGRLLAYPLVGYMRLLELSPFTLAGVAVTAALVGDWLGRELLTGVRRIERQQTLKPF